MSRDVGHPVRAGLDLLDGQWYAEDPHEVWTWLRRKAPVYWDEGAQVWGISRHDDVLAIEKDPSRFSSRRGPRPHMDALRSMISMDDPDHRKRRSLVNRGFTPRHVAALEPFIADACRTIVDAVCERGECDFVWDIAAPLPVIVIAHLLGFAPETHDDLMHWSDDMLRATNASASPEVQATGLEAALAVRDLQLQVIEQCRREAPAGLISTLCQAEIDGERLDDESIVEESLLLLIGGDETTRHVITGGMEALLQAPDQLALLAADIDLLPTAVEELLRWVSPVKNMARTLAIDVELRGQQLREGDQLLLFYPSANRDEDVFDAPHRLDIARDPNPHLAFGFGPHFCLGASLARLELRCMFRAVLTRLPDLALATDDLPRRPSNFISGAEAMPVTFTPTAKSGGPT